jgi:PhnB protein
VDWKHYGPVWVNLMANSLDEQLSGFIDALMSGQVTTASDAEREIAAVAEIAVELRNLPQQSFRDRLRDNLIRRTTTMATSTASETAKPVREDLHTVTPYISVRDAMGLIEFVKTAFGAEGTIYGTGSQGGIHSEFRIGDSILMIGGGGAWKGTPRPTALHYYVDDVDETYARALAAGAVSMVEPMEAHGERLAGVKDTAGNEWYIARRLSGSHTDEGLRTVNVYLHPNDTVSYIEFLKNAFAADEVAVFKSPDGIVQHAKIRIGDSVVEMGEAHGQYQPMPTTFFLYVEDVDSWYTRAVKGGARAASEPANQAYGDRVASVTDPQNNLWYIATHIA